jgi:hypothetical protein
VITIGWSGQMDFLHHDGKNYFQEIDFTLQPIQESAVWDGVLDKNSMWAYADQGSYKMALRKVRNNWESCKERALELQPLVQEKFNEDNLHKGFVDALLGFDSSLIEPLSDSEEVVLEFD